MDKKRLLDTCEYFRKYDDDMLAGKFELQRVESDLTDWLLEPADDPSAPSAEHSMSASQSPLIQSIVDDNAAVPEETGRDDEECLRRSIVAYQSAHGALFRMILGVSPDQIASPEDTPTASLALLLLTNLSSVYGCIAHAKFQIISMLYTWPSLGRHAFNTCPMRVLEIGLRLENRALLDGSFGHAVGLAHLNGEVDESADEWVVCIVSEGVSDLEDRLARTMKAIEAQHFGFANRDMSTVVAEYIYQQYFRSEKRWPRDLKNARQTFTALKQFDELRGANDVLDKLNMDWVKVCVDSIENALDGAQKVFASINENDWQRNQYDDSGLEDFDAAYGAGNDWESVVRGLDNLIRDAQQTLKKLKVDWDLGYFSCAEVSGRLPWEQDV